MYTYNLDSRKMVMVGDKLIMPIVSEHIKCNGYEINNSEGFWENSANFMSIDVNESRAESIFGKYPPIYSKSNIPIFSNYSFDKFNDSDIIISYAADSLIYVRDDSGELKYSFGYDSGIIDSEYTQTKSFDEYQEKYKKELRKKSYFTYLKAVGDYVIRGYKTRGENGGYGFQIYKDNDLIGKVDSPEEIMVLGASGGYIYATLPADLENNNFRIVKICLRNF
ncbi:MAG: DUF4221 family protein [Rikenellaceae bacterium]